MAEFGPETAAAVVAAAEAVAGQGNGSASQPAADASREAPAAARPGAPQRRRRRVEHLNIEDGIQQLPPYARSLLKVRVPVAVTLATTKQAVGRIVELGPGSIIQFDKSCEETLGLEAGNQQIAVGEAVKVGDKFGLRITSMIMPAERFWTVQNQRGLERAVRRTSP